MQDKIKNIGILIVIVVISVAGGWLLGKGSQPAEIVTLKVTETKYLKDTSTSAKASDVTLASRTSKIKTGADGSKSEITVEQFLAAHSLAFDSQTHEEAMQKINESTVTTTSNLFLRIGVITNVRDFLKPQVLATASYKNCEAVAHSDLKTDHWVGGTCGYGF